MNKKLILAIIIVMGFMLRVIFINSSPPSLYGDELTIALDANSLYHTGYDQLGNFLPLTFQMGAGRPAGYVYGSIPFVAIFGSSALGVRGLSILSGLGIIILCFYIGCKLFSERVGVAASFIAAVSPWDIALSRGGFEAHFALFLALLGFYLFLKAREGSSFYILSALSFGLTLHTYPTYKLSLLLFLPLLIWFVGVENIHKGKRSFLLGLIIFMIMGLLAINQTFFEGSETRFSSINIFSQTKLRDSIEQKINFERNITKLPQTFSKYFHNKGVEYTKVLVENYLQNFSMDFLVLHGDRNPRHNMATMGEIYFVDLVLILVGILTFRVKQKRVIIFLIVWILLAPIGTAVVDLPHALRSAFMLPPFIILSALGLSLLIEQKKKIQLFLLSLSFIIQFAFFIQKLIFLSPAEYSNFWSYSAKLASRIAQENRSNYDYIILSDRIDNIEFAYPVYVRNDPNLVISQNKSRTLLNNNLLKKFDNIYIGYVPESQKENLINSLKGSVLYIESSDESKSFKNPELINGLNGINSLVLEKKGLKQ